MYSCKDMTVYAHIAAYIISGAKFLKILSWLKNKGWVQRYFGKCFNQFVFFEVWTAGEI